MNTEIAGFGARSLLKNSQARLLIHKQGRRRVAEGDEPNPASEPLYGNFCWLFEKILPLPRFPEISLPPPICNNSIDV